MISYFVLVTISHSDSRLRLVCLGYFLSPIHCFRSLNIVKCLLLMNKSIQMVQSYLVYVSGRRFDRDRFELTWTENDSPDQNRIARPRSWVAPHRDPNRDHGPVVLRPNVRIQVWIRKSRKNILKTLWRKNILNNEFCLKKEDSKDQHIDW